MRIHPAILPALVLLAGCAARSPGEPYRLTPGDVQRISGTYDMSNGDVLKVSREQRRYWAETKATGRREIVPVAPYVFVEKGGATRFTFKDLAFSTEVEIEGLALAPNRGR